MDNVDMGRVECRVVWAAGRLRDGASLGNEMMTQGRPVPAQTSTAHCTLNTAQASTAHTCTCLYRLQYSTDGQQIQWAGRESRSYAFVSISSTQLSSWMKLSWNFFVLAKMHAFPFSIFQSLSLSWLSWYFKINHSLLWSVLLFHVLSESFRAFQSLLWHFIIINLSVLHRLWHKVFQNTKIVMKEPRNCANIYEQPLMTEAIRRRSQDLL